MLVLRGRLQSLQSEGKRTGKTLRTMVNNGATKEVRCSARCVRRCRSRVPRLLKTTLQSMVPVLGALVRCRQAEGTEDFSIVSSQFQCNVAPDTFGKDSRRIHGAWPASHQSHAAYTCIKRHRRANLRRHSYFHLKDALSVDHEDL